MTDPIAADPVEADPITPRATTGGRRSSRRTPDWPPLSDTPFYDSLPPERRGLVDALAAQLTGKQP